MEDKMEIWLPIIIFKSILIFVLILVKINKPEKKLNQIDLKKLTIKQINQQLDKDFGYVKISFNYFTGAYVLKIHPKKYKNYDMEKHKSFIWDNGEIKFNYLELKKDIEKIMKGDKNE